MTFTIFKKTGEIHFYHKGFEDIDGYDGYYEDIEIDDDDVESDIVDFVIDEYFIKQLRFSEREIIKTVLHSIFSELELYDSLKETFYGRLRDKYENKANES